MADQAAPEPFWLNQSAMARSIGISVKSFAAWNLKPVAVIGRENFYDVASVRARDAARHEKEVANVTERFSDDGQSPAEVEKTLLIRQQRIAQEMKNEQARRELAPVSLISWTLSKVGSQIAAILESIPLKIKTVAPRLSAVEIEHVKREIVKAQNAASNVGVDLDEYYGTNPSGDLERDPGRTEDA